MCLLVFYQRDTLLKEHLWSLRGQRGILNVTTALKSAHNLMNWALTYTFHKTVMCCCLRPKRLDSHREESWTSKRLKLGVCLLYTWFIQGNAAPETSPCRVMNPPGKQSHLNPPDRLTHAEPCWHRPSTQWFIGVLQCRPVYPCWHTHLEVFSSFSQRMVLSGLQGFDTHWFTDEEQSLPRYPVRGGIKGMVDAMCCVQ